MLTSERVDAIFTEMEGYVLELLPDPTALGPQYFRDLIAICRNYQNRVSLVLSELDRERLTLGSELRRLEASYGLEYDHLMANDPRVKSLSNVEDRKSTANYMLRDQRLALNEVKDQLAAAEAVHKVVTHRNRELHATMTAIKDQKRSMQLEITSGAFYGDERNPTNTTGAAKPATSPLGISAEELAALLSGDDLSETQSASDETVESGVDVSVTSPESDDDDIESFLSAVD